MAQSLMTVLAFALLTGVAAEAKAGRSAVVPMEIIYGTGDLIHDAYAHAYNAIEGLSTKHGIHTTAQAHLTAVLTEDPIGHVCSKAGKPLLAKDIKDHMGKAQAAVLQAKAQVYEHAAKAQDKLNDVAGMVVTQFEKHVPSYTGVVPKTFGNVALFAIYSLFVVYVVFRIARFVIGLSLGIFCCVCCCGCCRGGAAKKGKNSGKKTTPDAKATPTKTTAKAKAGKK